MIDAEIAWAAGLFEGEGCISTNVQPNKSNPRYRYPRLEMVMTDLDSLARFQRIIGGSISSQPDQRKPYYKLRWHWSLVGQDFYRAAHLLRPYLGTRRRKRLDEVLALPFGRLR